MLSTRMAHRALALVLLGLAVASPAAAQSAATSGPATDPHHASSATQPRYPGTRPSTDQIADRTSAATQLATTQPTKVDERSVTGGGNLFPDATPANVLKVTEKVFPAVVRIDVTQEVYEQGKRTERRGIGSGTIFDEEGHILTNYHVAGRGVEFSITLANKEKVKARLVGDDHWTDLAVLQMDLDEVREKNIDFTFATLGTSEQLTPGQDVIAIGTPFGLARTLTLGVVSNTERTFYPERQEIDGYETGDFSNWIQMDTPIAPGNSGGPLVDLDAKVVGVNTRGFQGQALNFAIPIDAAKPIVTEILATATDGRRGRVTRGYLGIDFQPLQDFEESLKLDADSINKGVLVGNVDRNSPATKAGLRQGDILLAIDGVPTNARFPEEIAAVKQRVASLPLDSAVELRFRRDKEEMTGSATVQKLESKQGDEREMRAWGLSVRDITRALAVEEQYDDDKGVVVTSITPGFAAQKAEIRPGDIIRRVDGTAIEDLEAFEAIYNDAVEAKKTDLLIDIKRGRGLQSKVLKVDPAR